MQVGVLDDTPACQFDGCLEHDLLPATCLHCHRLFCSEHILLRSHQCPCVPDAQRPTCPLCGAVVLPSAAGESIDEAVSLHMDRGCRRNTASSLATISRQQPVSWYQSPPLPRPARVQLPSQPAKNPAHQSAPTTTSNPVPPSLATTTAAASSAAVPRNQRSGTVVAGSLVQHQTSKSPTVVSLSALLALRPGNEKAGALGRPLGTIAPLSTDAWVPLVYTLAHVHPPLPASSSTATLGFLPIPPLFVYLKRSYSLGKALDMVVNEVELRYGAFASSSGVPAPCYLFLIPPRPPDGATEVMYPPQTLSGLVGQTVPLPPATPQSSGTRTSTAAQRRAQRHPPHAEQRTRSSATVVFVSNAPQLPEGLLEWMRQGERPMGESNCLVM